MEDVLTELPPPSRFFLEDLNNFAPPAPPLPSPFILHSTPNSKTVIRPSLLIIAISTPSLHLLHHLSPKTLIGTLILPEIPSSGNSVNPSLKDKSCNLYAISHGSESIVLANFQYSVSSERTHSIAKTLIGQNIIPQRVVIFDSVQSRNFRGRISTDDTFVMKLETSRERKRVPLLKSLSYFPSGSVVEGLGAALLGCCQMMNIKATLCVSWPESGGLVTSVVKDLLLKDVLPNMEVSIEADDEDEGLRFGFKNHYLDSELYT
ncbi:hypothetical protein HanRHA438_Chr08g0336551 [Helianthus annuus]|uniref:Proteasome assembly chaperone 1 n=1 Tax=Helianthus annuus TaxID=4232 RepID=A0A251U2T6_HELAN|nr:uncharacterized protein LOC110872151 [Helianthus annuus]KAF5794184.1 hypothetical protein HanXRQr2_Chr08g0325281 [Helianthus annuus]KAJ0552482.1 hypothetical protein HanHA89_Chr08g0285741 [Helianthus annuus]KAJ0721415.1 hypothetical protein HanOQP8_Chr08g0275311 [Helianthus annuus]KAJ0896611.1 hypothetical protein HanRHA438_Chr08g0336551 [Helianthus annuus]